MTDAEIQAAIRDAEQYAAEDAARRAQFAQVEEARKLLNEAEDKLKEAGKDMPKDEKRALKAAVANVQRHASKRPEKMKDSDYDALASAVDELRRLL